MKNTIREQSWTCVRCDFQMDACTDTQGNNAPCEGDLSLCLNCGYLYIRHSDKWEPATNEKFNALPSDIKKHLAKVEAARQLTYKEKVFTKLSEESEKL